MAEAKVENEIARKMSKKSSKKSGPKVPTLEIQQSAEPKVNSEIVDEEAIKRREAKRIRAAKKVEEQKKLALAEQEKQRKRQEEQLAALNLNAEECQEDLDNSYGQDDFEDYDDDFEEEEEVVPVKKTVAKKTVNENEVLDVRQALAVENAAAKDFSTSSSSSKKKQRVVEKVAVVKNVAPPKAVSSSLQGLARSLDPRAKRIKEIRERKQFGIEKFDALHLPPLSNYDQYLRKLRTGDIRQAHSQSNEDARTIHVQTEDIDLADESMQFPDDIGIGSTDGNSINAARMQKFMQGAAQMFDILLEENVQNNKERSDTRSERENSQLRKSTTAWLGEKIALGWGNEEDDDNNPDLATMLNTRSITDFSFSPDAAHLLVVAYSHSTENDEFANQSVLALWDLNQPEMPTRWLLCQGHVTKCQISSGCSPNIAIGGSLDGQVHVWDILGSNGQYAHKVPSVLGNAKLRVPFYSTNNISIQSTSHVSEICAIELLDKKREGSGCRFCTLDDRGMLAIWNVVEETQSNAEVSMRLILSGCLNAVNLTYTKASKLEIGPTSCTIAVFPNDVNQYLVGGTEGTVSRGNRFGNVALPKRYTCWAGTMHNSKPPFLGSIVDIQFNQFCHSYFLVGYASGTICLYHVDRQYAIRNWDIAPDADIALSSVTWSTSQPLVFYAIGTDNKVFVWDLMANEEDYIATYNFLPSLKANNSHGVVKLSACRYLTRTPSLAVACDSKITVHNLSECYYRQLDKSGIDECIDYFRNTIC